MSQDGSSFKNLLAQLQNGRSSAASQVFDRFADRLVALARSRMNPQILQRVDPEDVTQSVFRSFFQRQEAGQFRLENWGGLWGLLVTMTVRKCGRRAEEFYAARRDVRRETRGQTSPDESSDDFDIQDLRPTPDEGVALTELIEKLMEGLDPRAREALTLRLQGYSVAEISQQIGRTQRTIHRILEGVQRRLAVLW
jgi:RNA polymerase sigma-70 factor, ECF subfamily